MLVIMGLLVRIEVFYFNRGTCLNEVFILLVKIDCHVLLNYWKKGMYYKKEKPLKEGIWMRDALRKNDALHFTHLSIQ